MAMSDPPHPGHSIRGNCLDPLGLNVTEAARVLGVARHTLSRVLNGHAAISPEMAIRLEKAGWSNAEVLAAPTDYVRSRASTQGRRPDQRQAIPAAADGVRRCRSNARRIRPESGVARYGFVTRTVPRRLVVLPKMEWSQH